MSSTMANQGKMGSNSKFNNKDNLNTTFWKHKICYNKESNEEKVSKEDFQSDNGGYTKT